MIDAHLNRTHKAQVGALVVRGKPGSQEVLLVTSRDTGRWVIPKGWPMKGRHDHEAAAQEAFEEAGITGKIHRKPIGAFTYEKRVGVDLKPIRVMVYVIEIADKLKDWPEKSERRRQWMTAIEASTLVEEPGLRDILLRLNAMPHSPERAQIGGVCAKNEPFVSESLHLGMLV